jgi:hypothetical protein
MAPALAHSRGVSAPLILLILLWLARALLMGHNATLTGVAIASSLQ